MSLSNLKNISSIYLYFISVVCFIISNYMRDRNQLLYEFLILVGLVFFVLGIVKRIKSK
jgi:hypothetical protein